MTSRRSIELALRPVILGLAVTGPVLAPSMLFAQDAAATPAAPAADAAQPSKELYDAVENYWHFGKIARYDLQNAAAEKVAELGTDPAQVLVAFEKVVASRENSAGQLEEWITRWQGLDATKDSAKKMADLIAAGRLTRRADPGYIQRNIERLAINEVGYQLGLQELRNSGELSVPLMFDVLRDPEKKRLHGPVSRALRDLGRLALNPMVAATEMEDANLLPTVVLILGDLGYDVAAPYVAAVAARPDATEPIKKAVAESLQKLGKPANANAGELFYDLANKFYYDRAAIQADSRYPKANVWMWSPQGLIRKEVPPAIFNDIMAMRTARMALKAGAAQADAQSLWLAANYQRELDLKEGEVDPTQAEGSPSPSYYGTASGVDYLNRALRRSLTDRNAALALKIIGSMQQIAGDASLKLTSGDAPLVTALQYGDRRVRFEAAFAIAGALPQAAFQGMETVVPLLSEAMSQTGQPTVLLVLPNQDLVNSYSEALKAQNFVVSGATDSATAIASAASLPAVDVMVVSGDLPADQLNQLLVQAANTPKLAGSARLVLTKSAASVWEERKVNDPLLSTAVVADPAGLVEPIKAARMQGGAVPMDAAAAEGYAMRAGELMKKVATGRGQIFDLATAKNSLLAALGDSRPAIVKLAGEVLAVLVAPEAQSGLLAKAADTTVAEDVRVSLLKSLADSARFHGNQLSAEGVATVEKLVAEGDVASVKAAAAEVRGALNLGPELSKQLILNSPAK